MKNILILLYTLAALSSVVSENITEQTSNENTIDPVLAPVLISLFTLLLIFVILTFYIGIKNHLESINYTEDLSKTTGQSLENLKPIKIASEDERKTCGHNNEGYLDEPFNEVVRKQSQLGSTTQENSVIRETEVKLNKKTKTCTLKSYENSNGYTVTAF